MLQSAVAVVTHWLDTCSRSTLKPPVPRAIGTSTLAPTYHHWEIRAGSFGTYVHTDPGDWIRLGLNGNDRWMKKVDIALSHRFQGYSVVDGNVLRNTDIVESSKRDLDAKPQRRDQDLHGDLPTGVFGLDLTQDHINIKDKIRYGG